MASATPTSPLPTPTPLTHLQELEEQLGGVQGELADCCSELAAAQQAAAAATAEGREELQRRQSAEQLLLAARQEVERWAGRIGSCINTEVLGGRRHAHSAQMSCWGTHTGPASLLPAAASSCEPHSQPAQLHCSRAHAPCCCCCCCLSPRLLHEPPNTLELRLLEAEAADLKFKLQTAEGQLVAERQQAAAAEQAALEARRCGEQAEERLVVALGR